MLRNAENPLFCISCILNIIPFCNSKEKISAPANIFLHNKLFQLVQNPNNLTDESSNDDTQRRI